MVNSLLGLVFHPVICSNNQDNNICHLGTTGTHFSKGSMARSIEEYHVALAGTHIIGSNMLGNAAGLTQSHISFTNGVQDRCLAMVNMTHDCYNRRPGQRFTPNFLFLFFHLHDIDLFSNCLFHFITEICCYKSGGINIQDLVNRGHNPKLHEFCDNLVDLYRHPVGQVANADGFKNLYSLLNCLGFCRGSKRFDFFLFALRTPPPWAIFIFFICAEASAVFPFSAETLFVAFSSIICIRTKLHKPFTLFLALCSPNLFTRFNFTDFSI